MDDGNRRFDEGRLAQNLMLGAWAHGIGSCIGSLYPEHNTRRAKSVLGVANGKWLHTAISLGYPADPRARLLSAERGNLSEVPLGRSDLEDLISWERFGAPPAARPGGT
jgi:nitroreductase